MKRKMNYIIRNIEKSDYPAIPKVYASSFNEPPWEDDWHKMSKFNESTVWVAVWENIIFGFIISFYSDKFSIPYISVVAVSAPYKHMGIGSSLVYHANEYWQSQGYSEMLVHTDAFRKDARALYKKCGFLEKETADDGTITLFKNI